MVRVACALALGIALPGGMPPASAAAPELKVLATDPPPDSLLARQQSFYVRFEVKSAAPVAVSASGLFAGKAVIDDGGSSPPAMLPANGGIGVAGFFYWGEKPTRIDEVRLKLSDPQSGAQISEHAFPVALTWLMDDPPPRAPAAWVSEWQQAQRAARDGNARNSDPAAESTVRHAILLALAAGAIIAAIAVFRVRRRRAPAADDGNARR